MPNGFFVSLLSLSFYCSAAKTLPRRLAESGGISFKSSCQKSADLMSLTIDGKQKEFDGIATYANVKSLLKNIQKSAYFEKLNQTQSANENSDAREYCVFSAHSIGPCNV